MHYINLELLTRICRDILGINKLKYHIHFKQTSVELRCLSEDYKTCTSFTYYVMSNQVEPISLELPVGLVNLISSLSIKSVTNVELPIEIIRKNTVDITINNHTFECNRLWEVDKKQPITFKQSSFNPLVEVIKCFHISNEKSNFISIYKGNVLNLCDDTCNVKIYSPKLLGSVTKQYDRNYKFNTEQSKFIYNTIGKLKLDDVGLSNFTDNTLSISFNVTYKLSNKEISSVNVVFSTEMEDCLYQEDDILLAVRDRIAKTELIIIDKQKFLDKIAQVEKAEEEKEENIDTLILLAKNKKIRVSDLKRALGYKEELKGVKIDYNFILFQYDELQLLSTLYEPGEIEKNE